MNPQNTNLLKFPGTIKLWSTGAIAGLAGGAAEILWIAIFSRLSGGEAETVARGVTGTLIPGLEATAAGVPLGIAIHMGLAITLGIAIAVLVRSLLPRTAPPLIEPAAVISLLVGVWAINFFLILPAINPAFVTLVPYTASLISKILFGASAAFVLKYSG